MNLETIIQNIHNWKDLRDHCDSAKFVSLFEQGIGFYFTFPKDKDYELVFDSVEEGENCFHAYAGCSDKGELVFYLIHSSRDTKEQFEKGDIENYIVPCEITKDGTINGPEEIPSSEAQKLIQNWKDNHIDWINKQANSKDGFYQAFFIPEVDIQRGVKLKAYFALKPSEDPDPEVPFQADLIISDMKNSVVSPANTFTDLARPVPPFKPGVLSKDSYFLLECTVKDDYIRLG